MRSSSSKETEKSDDRLILLSCKKIAINTFCQLWRGVPVCFVGNVEEEWQVRGQIRVVQENKITDSLMFYHSHARSTEIWKIPETPQSNRMTTS